MINSKVYSIFSNKFSLAIALRKSSASSCKSRLYCSTSSSNAFKSSMGSSRFPIPSIRVKLRNYSFVV